MPTKNELCLVVGASVGFVVLFGIYEYTNQRRNPVFARKKSCCCGPKKPLEMKREDSSAWDKTYKQSIPLKESKPNGNSDSIRVLT